MLTQSELEITRVKDEMKWNKKLFLNISLTHNGDQA